MIQTPELSFDGKTIYFAWADPSAGSKKNILSAVVRPLPSVSHKHRWYRAASTDIRQTQ